MSDVKSDPFTSATAGAGSADPFGQKPSEVKTSDYPTFDELDGKLVVIQPTKHETGLPNPFDREKTRDRVTADVTVIDVENPRKSVTHKDMFISQGALIGQIKGLVENRGMLLGKVRKFPSKQTPDETPLTKTTVLTPDSVDLLLAEWLQAGAKGQKPSFAWKLQDFTNTEKDVALEWYKSRSN